MIYKILVSSIAVNAFSARAFMLIMLACEEKNKNIMSGLTFCTLEHKRT